MTQDTETKKFGEIVKYQQICAKFIVLSELNAGKGAPKTQGRKP
jgi:hypothetical protein